MSCIEGFHMYHIPVNYQSACLLSWWLRTNNSQEILSFNQVPTQPQNAHDIEAWRTGCKWALSQHPYAYLAVLAGSSECHYPRQALLWALRLWYSCGRFIETLAPRGNFSRSLQSFRRFLIIIGYFGSSDYSRTGQLKRPILDVTNWWLLVYLGHLHPNLLTGGYVLVGECIS